MERQKFEDSFKDSFENAEVSPSDNLWTNIELDLERAEGKVMKKRILFFKLMAAASVLFAMTFAGVGLYYINKNQTSDQVASNVNNAETKSSAATDGLSEGNKTSPLSSEKLATDESVTSKREVGSDNVSSANDNRIASAETNKDKSPESSEGSNAVPENGKNAVVINSTASVKTKRNALPVVSTEETRISDTKIVDKNLANNNVSEMTIQKKEVDLNVASLENTSTREVLAANVIPSATEANSTSSGTSSSTTTTENTVSSKEQLSAETDPVVIDMLKRLKEEEAKYTDNSKKKDKENKRREESVWASIGFAAGSFNSRTTGSVSAPVQQNSTFAPQNAALSSEVVKNQASASGSAYSLGLSFGGKVSNRWVIQGGVNYMQQSSDYASNAVALTDANFKAASINEVDKLNSSSGKSDTRLLSTSTYNVNSSLQYMSVPLQAGYIIVNRSFGVQMNAGVSTDLFIRNTLTPDQGTLEKTSQGNGEDSPYRPVNFSGLVGTELSYRFARHYRIALNPGIRYPLSSIYKSDITVSSTPLIFDVGLRFRYIFH